MANGVASRVQQSSGSSKTRASARLPQGANGNGNGTSANQCASPSSSLAASSGSGANQASAQPDLGRQQQQQQQQQQQARQAPALQGSNWLSVSGGQQQQQQRRKSTLSANGFFIDYSCTRRRSSAASQQARAQQERDALQASLECNQFLRYIVTPVRNRRPSSAHAGAVQQQQQQQLRNASFCVGQPVGGGGASASTSSGQRRLSPESSGCASARASYCSPSTAWQVAQHHQQQQQQPPVLHHRNSLLVGASSAAASLAGSRKTSIFDPPGHSLAAPLLGPHQTRRRSTMVTGGGGVSLAPAVEQAATMLQVSKQAAALRRPDTKGRCVPVIGCSPTSIRASLAALDETRRYEKLLRKLERHQKKKAKERASEEAGRVQRRRLSLVRRRRRSNSARWLASAQPESGEESSGSSPIATTDKDYERRQSAGLRRKSLWAIRDVSQAVLRRAQQRRHRRRRSSMRYLEPLADGLSVTSTLSFVSSQTSLPCLANEDFEDDYEDEEDDDDEDDDESCEDDCDFSFSDQHSDPDERRQAQQSADKKQPNRRKQSIVSKAMRRIARTMGQQEQEEHDQDEDEQEQEEQEDADEEEATTFNRPLRDARRRKSVSVAANLNYLHYYYYLRDNSLDAIYERPLASGGAGDLVALGGALAAGQQASLGASSGTPMSEHERRTRLYINFSLARLEILNVKCDRKPEARLAERLDARATANQTTAAVVSRNTDLDDCAQPTLAGAAAAEAEAAEQQWSRRLFDLDQEHSTDVSLTLSTSSTSLDSSSTSRNSSSLSSAVSTVSSSARIAFRSSRSTSSRSKSSKSPPSSVASRSSRSSSSSATIGSGIVASGQPVSCAHTAASRNAILETRQQLGRPSSSGHSSAAPPPRQVSGGGARQLKPIQIAPSRSAHSVCEAHTQQQRHHQQYCLGASQLAPNVGEPSRQLPRHMSEVPAGLERARLASRSSASSLHHEPLEAKRAAVCATNVAPSNWQQNQQRQHRARAASGGHSTTTGALVDEAALARETSRFRFSFRSSKSRLRRQPIGGDRRQHGDTESIRTMTKRTSMSWDQLPVPARQPGALEPAEQRHHQKPPSKWTSGLFGFVASASGFAMGVHPSTRRSFRQPRAAGQQHWLVGKQSAPDSGGGGGAKMACRLSQSGGLGSLAAQQSAEERLAASNLLDEFEAQMSQAASLAKEAAAAAAAAKRGRNQHSNMMSASYSAGARQSAVLGHGASADASVLAQSGSAQQHSQLLSEHHGIVSNLAGAKANSAAVSSSGSSNSLLSARSWAPSCSAAIATTVAVNASTSLPTGAHHRRPASASSAADCGQQRCNAGSLRVPRVSAHIERSSSSNLQVDRLAVNVERGHFARASAKADHLIGSGSCFSAHEGPRARAYSTGSSDKRCHSARLQAAAVHTEQISARQAPTDIRREQRLLSDSERAADNNREQAERQRSHKQLGEGGAARTQTTADKQPQRPTTSGVSTALFCGAQRSDFGALETNRSRIAASSTLATRWQEAQAKRNSFNCMLLGARQTGKRTIVKCFVKLLDEFKLAAAEFKREKMLSKLVECSERLQELASKQQQEIELQSARSKRRVSQLSGGGGGGGGGSARRRSRLNSWLGERGSRLLNLSPSSRRRQSNWSNQPTAANCQQRRHAAGQLSSADEHSPPAVRVASSATLNCSPSANFLAVKIGKMSSSCCNKSDTNINYCGEIKATTARHNYHHHQSVVSSAQRLEVPNLGGRPHSSGDSYRRHSSQALSKQQARASVQNEPALAAGGGRKQSQAYSCGAREERRSSHLLAAAAAHRRSSLATLSRRKKNKLLSLKELNRRKLAVRFNTRRQLSENLLGQLSSLYNYDGDAELSSDKAPENSQQNFAELPDAFLVVYSINDILSFEYARMLIERLREACNPNGEQHFTPPIPIILVANKGDLQRAREVKIDEGRSLARKNKCKFIEISCTVGFNLDNLLVGLRTQLILKHHIVLNSIQRPGFKQRYAKLQQTHGDNDSRTRLGAGQHQSAKVASQIGRKAKDRSPIKSNTKRSESSENILVRFYKRYVWENLIQHESNYDCDNFSKL